MPCSVSTDVLLGQLEYTKVSIMVDNHWVPSGPWGENKRI